MYILLITYIQNFLFIMLFKILFYKKKHIQAWDVIAKTKSRTQTKRCWKSKTGNTHT